MTGTIILVLVICGLGSAWAIWYLSRNAMRIRMEHNGILDKALREAEAEIQKKWEERRGEMVKSARKGQKEARREQIPAPEVSEDYFESGGLTGV